MCAFVTRKRTAEDVPVFVRDDHVTDTRRSLVFTIVIL
jgi:hypothetical protein